MNEQVSLSFSKQPNGESSVSLSIIPSNADGSLNTESMTCKNISQPEDGSPDAALLSAINEAISVYRTAKAI